MALQGTLDTFGLADVLRLLASTNKTGRLRVSGDRAAGSLWIDGGHVVAASVAAGPVTKVIPVDGVFELLRLIDGSFVFEPELTSPDAGAPLDVEALLREAEHRLAAWREIEAVVPSLDVWLSLRRDLPRSEVVIDAARWRCVVRIGPGCTVRDLGGDLGLEEIVLCSQVKELVEIGLVEVGPERTVAPVAVPITAEVPVTPAASNVAEEPLTWQTDAEPLPEIKIPGDWVDENDDVAAPALAVAEEVAAAANGGRSMGIDIPGYSSLTDTWGMPPEPELVEEPDNDGPVELGNLTPAAARAIAAAAQASNEAERDAAIERAISLNDEPLDRKTLLRFLSSVRS